MTQAKAVGTPLAQKHGLQEAFGDLVDPSLYRSIVGSLQYLTLNRPDITHVVNLVSQFMQTTFHLQAIKRILRYVKGCPSTRRSTTGYNIYLGANCISWSSRKQHKVARSSAEAEYRALASTAAELTWITFVLRDIGVCLKTTLILFSDNLSALYMTTNPVMHARTKHVELDYHFVREKVAQGQLLTQFVRSRDQLADIHTKALAKDQFTILRSKLGVVKPPLTSLRGSIGENG
uniref:Uncharacterized mitochondrial protein AtMg00810-like n=1 Tax=Nicotiana tabacum TaxID=4097 RepID=A0A1S4C2N8_TOBAC|nr:PREDICTED: uncharacterized mitochondrial protein AtMg00810-like [Nicotiana tabacum]